MSNTRHQVLTKGKKVFILSHSSAGIVTRLKTAGRTGLSYSELARSTRSPKNSIYVFAQRLRDAALVRSMVVNGETRLVLLDPSKCEIGTAQRLG
jgi:hypothetical protein